MSPLYGNLLYTYNKQYKTHYTFQLAEYLASTFGWQNKYTIATHTPKTSHKLHLTTTNTPHIRTPKNVTLAHIEQNMRCICNIYYFVLAIHGNIHLWVKGD